MHLCKHTHKRGDRAVAGYAETHTHTRLSKHMRALQVTEAAVSSQEEHSVYSMNAGPNATVCFCRAGVSLSLMLYALIANNYNN